MPRPRYRRLPMNCSITSRRCGAAAMLDQIDALPGAERQPAAAHRHVQRHAGQHGLDVRRHVVRALDVVHPGRVLAARAGRSAVTRSVCTSGSAFSWMVSDAEVWRRIDQQRAVARAAPARRKRRGVAVMSVKPSPGRVDRSVAVAISLRRGLADRGQAAGHDARARTAQLLRCMSRCRSTIMSTSRRQTFSMKARRGAFEVARAVSRCLVGAVLVLVGHRRRRAARRRRRQLGRRTRRRRLMRQQRPVLQRGVLVLQPARSRFSSAARSSGTAWQAQPTACATAIARPVRSDVSSRTKPSSHAMEGEAARPGRAVVGGGRRLHRARRVVPAFGGAGCARRRRLVAAPGHSGRQRRQGRRRSARRRWQASVCAWRRPR